MITIYANNFEDGRVPRSSNSIAHRHHVYMPADDSDQPAVRLFYGGRERPADVLADLDLTAERPWMIVMDGIAAAPAADQDGTWEPKLLAAGYQRALVDGLSTFYVAEEHPELLTSLTLEPAASDDLGSSEQDADPVAELARVRALLKRLEEWGQASEHWARSAEARLQQTIDERDHAREQVREAEHEVALMKRSRSWLITAPLRGFRTSVREDQDGSASGGLKAFARPVLSVGLIAVRHNTHLRRAVESALKSSPALRRRLQSFADNRPVNAPGDV